ncbi:Hypothetical protein CINCED_3A005025 [Cinara cedri]|nr:Hypothetical protein CINCED_3A005025 [Cinara cedri]
MTEKAKRTNSQSIKDFTFDQRNYNFLRKELRPNEDSNKGYFGHVFFNISLTYIDRASDAYNYVQRLMDFSNLNALDSTVLTPDAFCEKKPAYVSNFNYEEAKQKLVEEYDNHTRNMSKDRLRRFEAGRLNESKDSEHKNDT